jgi:hypothetical protein
VFENAKYCAIHPAIGTARVGNSPRDYFIGPEVPGRPIVPPDGYKDSGDPEKNVPPRVRRQGARFRIYAYDEDHKPIGEVTTAQAEITWTVHLANTKAEWDRFAGTLGEELPLGQRLEHDFWRNRTIEDRESLKIDPGPRTVTGPNQTATFDGGKFRNIEVPLGDLKTDEDGRLIVLGGYGKSGSSNSKAKIYDYANNDYWYDDVSDGPVSATITLNDGKRINTVKPSWVIVAPPDFAPSVMSIVTLHDLALDVALRNGLFSPPFRAPSATPSFTHDIYPIFVRINGLQWVQQATTMGNAASQAFDLSNIDLFASNSHEPRFQEFRSRIFAAIRNPHLAPDSEEAKQQATALYIPALSGDDGDAEDGSPHTWLKLTNTQYDVLAKWEAGDFLADWEGEPLPSKEITPEGLDRAALEACTGGAFYPGMEAGWILRNPAVYAEPFRLSHTDLKAGDLTKRMACPWQADFFECRLNWWPTHRPDDVLTYEAYRRVMDLNDKLADLDQASPEYRRMRKERDDLRHSRKPWARGLPAKARPDGDMAMVAHWPQHGFVVDGTEADGALESGGAPQFVETERGRYDGLTWPEYFHILTNIEQHPDFFPKARELALDFFAGADYEKDENYTPFTYSPDAFDQRMLKIYRELERGMYDESRMDTGIIQYPVVVRREGDEEITKDKSFDVKPFSDRAVKERIRQNAPFNLVDGAWLQRIQSAGPAEEEKAHLFAIWDDEAGNGRVEQNHANVYDALLRSINIFMPSITSEEFIQQDLLPSAYIQAVFQLCVSLFPEEFFPEILGMTLYLEWEATPTLTQGVRLFRGRRIDPHFYELHVAIDNIDVGHGALAKEAIKLYLAKKEDEGVDVQELWQRIWCGYVTWATAGTLGIDLLELCLIIDHKQIDLSYPMMIVPETIKDVPGLLSIFQAVTQDPLSQYLLSIFRSEAQDLIREYEPGEPVKQVLTNALVDELNSIIQGENIYSPERFDHVNLSAEAKKLRDSHPEGEQLVRLNRILLVDAYPGEIAQIPKMDPDWFPKYEYYYNQKMVELIERKAPIAKKLHTFATIGGKNLAELFDKPEELVEILKKDDVGLIDKQHPRNSKFFSLTDFGGPMYKVFKEEEKSIILDWIESLSSKPVRSSDPAPTAGNWAARVEKLIADNAKPASAVKKHRNFPFPDESGTSKPLNDWFGNPRGMMAALKRGGWVKPGDSAGSKFYRQFISGGPMSFMGPSVANMIKQWIDTGAHVPGEDAGGADVSLAGEATADGPEITPSPTGPAEAPTAGPRPLRAGFTEKRKLIGMGSVH